MPHGRLKQRGATGSAKRASPSQACPLTPSPSRPLSPHTTHQIRRPRACLPSVDDLAQTGDDFPQFSPRFWTCRFGIARLSVGMRTLPPGLVYLERAGCGIYPPGKPAARAPQMCDEDHADEDGDHLALAGCQPKLGKLRINGKTAPGIWNAVLAA